MTKRDEAIRAGTHALMRGASMSEIFDAILKVIAEPDAEMVEAGARQLFASDCAINDDVVNWGRATDDAPRGYKTEVMVWEALARMCLPAIIHKLMGGGE